MGTASRDGHPQISMKVSVLEFDRETLAYRERAKRSALEKGCLMSVVGCSPSGSPDTSAISPLS